MRVGCPVFGVAISGAPELNLGRFHGIFMDFRSKFEAPPPNIFWSFSLIFSSPESPPLRLKAAEETGKCPRKCHESPGHLMHLDQPNLGPSMFDRPKKGLPVVCDFWKQNPKSDFRHGNHMKSREIIIFISGFTAIPLREFIRSLNYVPWHPEPRMYCVREHWEPGSQRTASKRRGFFWKKHGSWSGSSKNLTNVTLLGTNISPTQGMFEDDLPFPKVGYVNSLEGNQLKVSNFLRFTFWGHGLNAPRAVELEAWQPGRFVREAERLRYSLKKYGLMIVSLC